MTLITGCSYLFWQFEFCIKTFHSCAFSSNYNFTFWYIVLSPINIIFLYKLVQCLGALAPGYQYHNAEYAPVHFQQFMCWYSADNTHYNIPSTVITACLQGYLPVGLGETLQGQQSSCWHMDTWLHGATPISTHCGLSNIYDITDLGQHFHNLQIFFYQNIFNVLCKSYMTNRFASWGNLLKTVRILWDQVAGQACQMSPSGQYWNYHSSTLSFIQVLATHWWSGTRSSSEYQWLDKAERVPG